MSSVQKNLSEIHARIESAATRYGRKASEIQLVAVSKTHPPELIREAFEAGQRAFGESRVQDALPKLDALPREIEWHFIGHLQTNKIRKVVGQFALFHGVDNQNLALQMNRIAEEVESDPVYRALIDGQRATPEMTGADAIAASAHQIADTLNLGAICAWTSSGSTAIRIARERPNATVIALTPNRETARRLTLVWGVHPVVTKDASDADDMASRACKFAVREGYAKVGDRITVVAGVPFGTPGATNMVRIAYVTQEHAALA
jgi:hypothetical protein